MVSDNAKAFFEKFTALVREHQACIDASGDRIRISFTPDNVDEAGNSLHGFTCYEFMHVDHWAPAVFPHQIKSVDVGPFAVQFPEAVQVEPLSGVGIKGDDNLLETGIYNGREGGAQ